VLALQRFNETGTASSGDGAKSRSPAVRRVTAPQRRWSLSFVA